MSVRGSFPRIPESFPSTIAQPRATRGLKRRGAPAFSQRIIPWRTAFHSFYREHARTACNIAKIKPSSHAIRVSCPSPMLASTTMLLLCRSLLLSRGSRIIAATVYLKIVVPTLYYRTRTLLFGYFRSRVTPNITRCTRVGASRFMCPFPAVQQRASTSMRIRGSRVKQSTHAV